MHRQTDVTALLSCVAESICVRLSMLYGIRLRNVEDMTDGWHHFAILAQRIDTDGSVGGSPLCVAKLSATIDRSEFPQKIMYSADAAHKHLIHEWMQSTARILGVALECKE